MSSAAAPRTAGMNVGGVPHFPNPVDPQQVPAVITAAETTPVPWWAFWRQPVRVPFNPRITEIWQHVAYDQHVLGKKPERPAE